MCTFNTTVVMLSECTQPAQVFVTLWSQHLEKYQQMTHVFVRFCDHSNGYGQQCYPVERLKRVYSYDVSGSVGVTDDNASITITYCS